MAGRWFEEFRIGQMYEHEIRRTVTEADYMWFSNATCKPCGHPHRRRVLQGYRVRASAGQQHLYARPRDRALGSADDAGTTVTNLGMTDTRFPNPVFAGDTVRSRTTVREIRESKSCPNAGIVTFLHQGYNQRNKEVYTCTRQALMLKAPR